MKKRVFGVILAIVLVFGSFAGVIASAQDNIVPFVHVRGMDLNGLYFDIGTDNERGCIAKPEFSDILRTVSKAAFGIALNGMDGLAGPVVDCADKILGGLACDENGDSKYNVGTHEYTEAVSNYPELLERLNGKIGNELGLLKGAIEHYGAENVYYFNYDWRLDPFVNAEKLNALIETAKKDHNAKKVNMVCCSMGGIVADAYIYSYGSDSIKKIVFDSSAFCGTDVVTDLLQGKVLITADDLTNFLEFLTGSRFFSMMLRRVGLVDIVVDLAMKFVTEEKEYIYNNFLRDTFGTMPALWAMVQCDEYENCKNYMFPTDADKEKYSVLIKRTDRLQEMMSDMDDILLALPEKGVEVAVVASYGIPLIPIYESASTLGDRVLETRYMLGRANVAKQGKPFGDNYIPADPSKLSPDRYVDISGVLFPEYTWAIADAPHVGCAYGSEESVFLFWLFDYDGQPTVKSNPDYPQFMRSDSEMHLYRF